MTVTQLLSLVCILLCVWLAGGENEQRIRAPMEHVILWKFSIISAVASVAIVFWSGMLSSQDTNLPPFSKTGITFYPKVKP